MATCFYCRKPILKRPYVDARIRPTTEETSKADVVASFCMECMDEFRKTSRRPDEAITYRIIGEETVTPGDSDAAEWSSLG